jgi:hypothetical protein
LNFALAVVKQPDKLKLEPHEEDMTMKKRNLYIAWGILYGLCVGLGCIPSPTGILAGLCVSAALAFFIPPAMLLHYAIPRKQTSTVRLVGLLSISSLVLTTVLLILNFMSFRYTETAGNVLYAILILVSSPMVCAQVWLLSLFLWACLLVVSLKHWKTA